MKNTTFDPSNVTARNDQAPGAREISLTLPGGVHPDPAVGLPRLEDNLGAMSCEKATVHFPLTKPVPVKLISRIAKLQAAGIAVTVKRLIADSEIPWRRIVNGHEANHFTVS
jgi:hypothetical protein